MEGGGGGAAKEIISSLISGSGGRRYGDAGGGGGGGEREEEYYDDDDEEEEDEGEEEEGSPFSTPSPPPAALVSTVVPVPALPQPPPPPLPPVSSSFIMSMMSAERGGGGGDDMSTTTTLMLLGGKKRGRPRKYGPDGMPPSPTSSFSHTSTSDLSGKRSRGRPPGSGRRQLLATLGEWFACSAGGSFTPHVITIAAGEDVAARILSLSQKGPRAVCILSANGAISNVTLRQPGSSGGTLTYEGRFEILSLSGSFTITENSGVRSRTGGISVSLAGPDGRVVGGGVAGSLLAASPIQVVVGSFLPNAFKEHKRRSNLEPSRELPVKTSIPTTAAVLTAAMPISQEKDCETPSSTISGQNRGVAENRMSTNPMIANLTTFQTTVGWHGLQQLSSSEHKPSPSPDINISLPGE